MVTNKKYKEMCEERDLLQSLLNDCRDQLHDEEESYRELEKKIKERNDAMRRASSTLQNALETIKKQQDMLSFLYKGEMIDNPAVEFIGVKTYRNGWEYMMLHGDTLDIPKGADVTIWADHGEAIRIDVDHN